MDPLVGRRSLLYESSPREPWLTVHRGQQVTRREGTSKSNIFCAMGGFAPKAGWTQMGGWHHKIDHSSGVHGWILVLTIAVCTSF